MTADDHGYPADPDLELLERVRANHAALFPPADGRADVVLCRLQSGGYLRVDLTLTQLAGLRKFLIEVMAR